MNRFLLSFALLLLLVDSAAAAQPFQNQWQRYQRPTYSQPTPAFPRPNPAYSRPNPAYPRPNPAFPRPNYRPLPNPAWNGNANPNTPGYFRPTQPRPKNSPNTPAGSFRRVLPDGRVAIITPFSEKQKRELRQREAQRKKIRNIRLRELAEQENNDSLYPRLPGEFEKPDAIVISVSDWQPHHFDVLTDLIEKTRGRANVLILYNDKNLYDEKRQLPELIKLLAKSGQSGKSYRHIRFMNINLDTVWLRDFSPRLAETEDGGAVSMDFFYEPIRPRDDVFPKTWARLTGASHNLVPWSLQGGNLLSNGRGLALTTSRLFEENRIQRPGKTTEQDEAFVKQQFMKFCNIKELVVLKPLQQETTRHVDMFASFLAPDLVLVAKVDARLDPVNARILDNNARILSRVSVDGKPLRVERIWIPPRRGESWSTYTNIILTDRFVLIPTYQSDQSRYVQNAVRTYRRLLPKHHVATIDMTSMEKLGGSLHCLSCSLPAFGKLPKGMLTFEQAAAKAGVNGLRNDQ